MHRKLIIGLLVAVLLIVCFGTYFVVQNKQEMAASSSTETSSTINTSTTVSTIDSTVTKEDPLEVQIANMTLEEKVGQLFFVRVPEANQLEDIQNYHLGGYILFGRDVENESQTSLQEKIASYQAASQIPLLIGADEEGGTVSRISGNPNLVATPFASPQALFASGGWEAIQADTEQKAQLLTELGINTGLFPVADVATDPNSFIYDRTIGLDATATSQYVQTVVTALKAHHSGSTLKHFPGYGNNLDSHVEIVTDDRSLDDFETSDFLPFEAGIKAGADSILVSHNIVTAIDSNQPASISPAVHQLLRNELGFTGVIMTDDMDMAGLADFISQEEAGLKALQAGNDLVMSSSYKEQIPFVIQAVQAGTYSKKELDESVYRVLSWKKELQLLDID